MSVTVGAIRSSRPETLAASSRRLEEYRLEVLQLVQAVLFASVSRDHHWSGLASAAATNRTALVVRALARLASSIGASAVSGACEAR